MKKTSLILFALAVGLSSCGDQANEKRTSENMNEEFSDNPLVMVSELPYLAPDFTQIKNEHFEPAIMEGIRVKRAHIEKIIDQEEEPTFENTLVALERRFFFLDRKSTRLNSSHVRISYAVFCLKKK